MLLTKNITVKWLNRTRKWYENKGYIFTNYGDEFKVKVEDLTETNKEMIDLECDNPNCKSKFSRYYYRYLRDKNIGRKDYCSKCAKTFNKDSSKYLTQNRELRIQKLKQTIEDTNSLSYKKDSTLVALRQAFKLNNENIQEEVEKLGYNYYNLFDKKPSSYYNSIDNYKDIIFKFIETNKRFPTQLEINQDLHLSTLFNNGMTINELKQKLNYNDENDLIDDNGYNNASEGEYTISQFLINNTDIKYKRNVLINKNEGKYNCDWVTEPIDRENQIWIEYWGGLNDNNSFYNYNDICNHKMELYKKYNLTLISIYPKDFERLTYDKKQEYLHNIFSPFMKLKYKHIKNEIIIPPNKLSNEELLINALEYSNNKDFLPDSGWLKNNKDSLYNEIIKRFNSYADFAEQNNKKIKFKQHYWNKEKVFEKFDYLLKIYEEITTETYIKKLPEYNDKLKGICDYIRKEGGMIYFKLEYFNRIDSIPNKEIRYLINVENNINFPTNSTKPTIKQQNRAKQILQKLNINSSHGIKEVS